MNRKQVLIGLTVAVAVLVPAGAAAYNLASASSGSSSTQVSTPATSEVPTLPDSPSDESPTTPPTQTEDQPTTRPPTAQPPVAQPTTVAPIGERECLSLKTANRLLAAEFPPGEGPTPLTDIECPERSGLWAVGWAKDADGKSLFFLTHNRGWIHYDIASYWGDHEDTCDAVGKEVREHLGSCPE